MHGIPSKVFIFNYNNFTFNLTNKSFRLQGKINELLENYLKEYLDFGKQIFLIISITEFFIFKKTKTKKLKMKKKT